MNRTVSIPPKGAGRGQLFICAPAVVFYFLLTMCLLTAGCSRKYEKPEHYKGYDPFSSLGPKVGRQINWILQQIEVTEEQREKITTSLNDLAMENARVTKEYKKMMDDLMEAFQSEQTSKESFEKICDNSISQFKASSDRMVIALAVIYEVLTPSQRAKVAELWKKKTEK